jgi:3-hydroxyisobutyrate dehydrogenase-like beta-hydroxyacid dehydrogenase
MTASTADTSEPSEPAEFVVRRVGVVGLGHMGHAFAVNLVEDGHQVTVFDRDQKRAAALTGARAASGLADLAACDVVVTSLPGDDALAEFTLGPGGLVGVLATDAVHISTSTVSPEISRRVAKEHAVHHQDYVAAPVLGNPDFARERKLFVLAAGLPSVLEKVRPLLERFGQRLFVISDDASLANLFKLAANALTATTLECMGEVLALLRKGGVDRHLAYDVLTTVRFPGPQGLRRQNRIRALQPARIGGAACHKGCEAGAGRSRARGGADARREPCPRSPRRDDGARLGRARLVGPRSARGHRCGLNDGR